MTFDLVHGLGAFDVAALADRLALGTFFAISGYHKLFNTTRRASLATTFKADGCYSPFTMFAVPLGELLGGVALVVGLLTPVAALGLILICSGACLLDGIKRVREWGPLDAADRVDDFLYLPELLYVIMLSFLVLAGPGKWSVDALLHFGG